VSAITLRNVSIAYGHLNAVKHVDLDVAAGEWLTLVGPNGAGKSSVLRAIARLTQFTVDITIGGDQVGALRGVELARCVAMVPQAPHMPVGMTVSHYVMLGRGPHLGYLGREGRRDMTVVAAILDRPSLQAFAGRTLDQLSGGERQRAAIGRALAQEAPVLLVDEPTSSLDVARQQDVLELIDEIRQARGLTVVAAMHDLTLAGQYADRLALLVEGEVVMVGPPRDVLTEATISAQYGAQVRVIEHDGDSRAVVPIRRRSRA